MRVTHVDRFEQIGSDSAGAYRDDSPPSSVGYCYSVYGISLRSQFPIPLPASAGQPDDATAEIEIRSETSSFFSELTRNARVQRISCYEHALLEDASSYVRWNRLGEFHVSADGRRIACRRFEEAHLESFHVYLLGQALSFGLVKSGFEPIHATCVVIDGEAIAFLGPSGFGKSTLAAGFLSAGDRLLTDDLLLMRESAGTFSAYPGPTRIKLFPGAAHKLLREPHPGVPMNTGTTKMVIPLAPPLVSSAPVPVRAIYVLASPRQAQHAKGVAIAPLSPRDAFMALLTNTFNYVILQPDRLQRHFAQTHRIVAAVPVKTLAYPRLMSSIPVVREAILADVNRECAQLLCEA